MARQSGRELRSKKRTGGRLPAAPQPEEATAFALRRERDVEREHKVLLGVRVRSGSELGLGLTLRVSAQSFASHRIWCFAWCVAWFHASRPQRGMQACSLYDDVKPTCHTTAMHLFSPAAP